MKAQFKQVFEDNPDEVRPLIEYDGSLLSEPKVNACKPHPIANRTFTFSGQTHAVEAEALITLARFDEATRTYAHARSLIRTLNRTEALTTVRSDGVNPNFELVCHLEYARALGKATPRAQKTFLRKHFPESSLESIEASFEAFRCIETLEWIERYQPKPEGITSKDIWTLYDLLMRGTHKERSGGKRRENFRSATVGESSKTIYIPPDYQEIDRYIDDLAAFCNRPTYSPLVRAAIAHFQLEGIGPVTTGLDRWGRMLALLIWKQSGLITHVIPPISVTPAAETRTHTELLIPYRAGADYEMRSAARLLDDWTLYCAHATKRSVPFALLHRTCIDSLDAAWRDRCGEVHKDTVLDLVINELSGLPLISVPLATEISGKRYQTVAEAITRLTDTRIITEATQGKRNRLFVAREALERFTDLYRKHIPDQPTARETYFI